MKKTEKKLRKMLRDVRATSLPTGTGKTVLRPRAPVIVMPHAEYKPVDF